MYQILCDGELLYDPRQKEYLVGAPTLELAVNTSGTLSFSMPQPIRLMTRSGN